MRDDAVFLFQLDTRFPRRLICALLLEVLLKRSC
jgi:hypothetical protein